VSTLVLQLEGGVAGLVRERVERDPCLLDCLARGIVNLSELARQLAGELGEALGVEASVPAVKMALHRLSKKLRSDLKERVEEVLSSSTLIIHDSVSVATFPGELMPKALSVAAEIAGRARFIQVTQGFKNATVVVSSEDLDYMIERVGKPIEVIGDQAAVIIVSPPEIITTPGVIAYLSTYLSVNGVNITQIISCYIDTIIVLDSKQATKAYNLLYNIIRRKQKQ
jgi:hypothetical protein